MIQRGVPINNLLAFHSRGIYKDKERSNPQTNQMASIESSVILTDSKRANIRQQLDERIDTARPPKPAFRFDM